MTRGPTKLPKHARRYIYLPLPACPSCRSIDLVTYRTTRPEPGVIQRHMRCRICGERFIAVFERPA